MRVAVRFKNDKDRAKGSYVLAETGPIIVLGPGLYLVREEQLRALKSKNGRKKYDYEIVDLRFFVATSARWKSGFSSSKSSLSLPKSRLFVDTQAAVERCLELLPVLVEVTVT